MRPRFDPGALPAEPRDVAIMVPSDGSAIPGTYQPPGKPAADGPPFLLFHGLDSDRDEHLGAYARLAAGLARAGRASLRCDARAHGARAADPDEFTLLNLVRDGGAALDWLLATTGADRAVLVGTSFGAPPAILVARLRPDRVAALALIAPAADLDALFATPEDPRRRAVYGELVSAGVWRGHTHHDGHRAFSPQLAFELATVDLAAALARTPCPVTIVHGERDDVVPIAHSERLAQLAHVRLHRLAETEHSVTAVGDLLGEHPRSEHNIGSIERLLLDSGELRIS